MNAASWLEGLPVADHWRARLRTTGPRFATWMLALALGVQAAFIVTDLAGAGRAARSTAPGPQPLQPRFTDIAAITNAHLFGEAAVAKQNDVDAPETSMPLVLTGIIAGNDPQNGLAILGPNAQTAKVHAVGDTVPGGARLHSVYSDRVIIDRNGQLESLVLPRQSGAPAPAPSAASLPTQSPVIERMRRVFTEQPGLIADLLRPQAVMDGDKVRGFRVYPGRNRVAFARLGLRAGDQVVAINGTPLDDQDRGQAILNTLGTSPDARVTVIRNGQQQDLTLNIAQVAQEAETATAGPAGAFGMPNASQVAPGGPPTQANGPPGAPGMAPESAPPPPAAPGAAGASPTNTPPPEPAAPEAPQPR